MHKLRPALIILGWGTSTASAVLAAIFQGLLLPQFAGGGDLLPEVLNRGPWALILFYLGILGISILASLTLADFGKGLLAFFASYALAATLTFLVLSLPAYVGAFQFPDVLVFAAVNFTFGAFFPILLFVGFAGTILGTALSERLG